MNRRDTVALVETRAIITGRGPVGRSPALEAGRRVRSTRTVPTMIKYYVENGTIYKVDLSDKDLRLMESWPDAHLDVRPPRAEVVFTNDPNAYNLRALGMNKETFDKCFDSFDEAKKTL
jgi:hypothetical protein